MTPSEAKRTFANLMQKARAGRLSEHERLKLAQARQLLRRSRRPAMNAQKYIAWLNKTSVASGSLEDVRKEALEIFNSKAWQARHKETVLRITTYGTQRLISSEVLSKSNPKPSDCPTCHGTGLAPDYRSHCSLCRGTGKRPAGYVPPPKKPKRNPAGVHRLGPAEEVRYKRDVGRLPGYYKHKVESKRAKVYAIPAGWVYVYDRSILITETPPRKR